MLSNRTTIPWFSPLTSVLQWFANESTSRQGCGLPGRSSLSASGSSFTPLLYEVHADNVRCAAAHRSIPGRCDGGFATGLCPPPPPFVLSGHAASLTPY